MRPPSNLESVPLLLESPIPLDLSWLFPVQAIGDELPEVIISPMACLLIRLQCNYSFVKIFVLMYNLKETWNGKMSTWLDRFVRPGVCNLLGV
ncbi:unnamed protein product [Urochloa humidicola]